MGIGSVDQQTKLRYELMTGQQPPPEIILTRPLVDSNISVGNFSGQNVSLMPQILPQPQFIAQIPTKQYISSQSGIPVLLAEGGGIGEKSISIPISDIPSSAGDMITVASTVSLTPSNNMVTVPTYANNIIYPKLSGASTTSKIYGGALPATSSIINHNIGTRYSHLMPAIANIDPLTRPLPLHSMPPNLSIQGIKAQQLGAHTPSLAMGLRPVYIDSNTGHPKQSASPAQLTHLEDMKIGNLNQALNKMAVGCPDSISKSHYTILESTDTPYAALEKTTQNYSILTSNISEAKVTNLLSPNRRKT